MDDAERPRKPPLVLRIGHAELIVRRRYEVASTANDMLIALWFVAGSVMFFSPAWTRTGVWCFLAGSVELLIRPLIRLSRRLHLERLRSGVPAMEDPQDY